MHSPENVNEVCHAIFSAFKVGAKELIFQFDYKKSVMYHKSYNNYKQKVIIPYTRNRNFYDAQIIKGYHIAEGVDTLTLPIRITNKNVHDDFGSGTDFIISTDGSNYMYGKLCVLEASRYNSYNDWLVYDDIDNLFIRLDRYIDWLKEVNDTNIIQVDYLMSLISNFNIYSNVEELNEIITEKELLPVNIKYIPYYGVGMSNGMVNGLDRLTFGYDNVEKYNHMLSSANITFDELYNKFMYKLTNMLHDKLVSFSKEDTRELGLAILDIFDSDAVESQLLRDITKT